MRPSDRRSIGKAQCRNVRSKCRCSMCLQFTLIHAASCVLHRPTSQVIHRSELCFYRIGLAKSIFRIILVKERSFVGGFSGVQYSVHKQAFGTFDRTLKLFKPPVNKDGLLVCLIDPAVWVINCKAYTGRYPQAYPWSRESSLDYVPR